jgi:hypothetical protein
MAIKNFFIKYKVLITSSSRKCQKLYFYLSSVTFGLFLTILMVSCAGKNSRQQVEYLIQVDSVQLADTVKLKETFDITFYGVIGENGCYKFSRFILEQNDSLCKIQVVGTHPTGSDLVCPEVLPLLDGKKLTLNSRRLGALEIEIVNPGVNHILRKTVMVTP